MWWNNILTQVLLSVWGNNEFFGLIQSVCERLY